ncbi:MAG TPA: hemerythrin domain-containing protein [Thermoanaerobaculia bacterium]|nr:hemerythrin domain-containing protein [Thermoanaerobaculia bacterium]
MREFDLLSAQRALRSRFDDFQRALRNENRVAMEVAIDDFERHLRAWTEAEEKALLPALERAKIPGRDVRRELRLEYVQIRELTHYVALQIAEQAASMAIAGYVENLDRRLHAHEREMESVYYPAAAPLLDDAEWSVLGAARPPA